MSMVSRFIDWFMKECPVCDGTGVTVCHCNEQYQIICPECMGKGIIEESVVVQNIIEVPCDNPQCQKGKVPCSLCHGSGQMPDGQACPECRGKKMVDCPVCQGVGRIERPHQEQWIKHRQCPTCGGKRYVDCPYCHGTKNRVCPQCGGKGRVVNKGRVAVAGVAMLLLTAMPVISMTIMGFALAGTLMYLACQYFPPAAEQECKDEAVQMEDAGQDPVE